MADYLTNDTDLKAVADAIRAKGGTSVPLTYPSGFVSAIQAIDTTGEMKPATLTLTSSNYTGNKYGVFIFVNSEGHLEKKDYTVNSFTFPITIITVVGGVVVFIPDGFPGIVSDQNLIGGEIQRYLNTFCILVTNPQASVDIYDSD